jgi:hypothetical protein
MFVFCPIPSHDKQPRLYFSEMGPFAQLGMIPGEEVARGPAEEQICGGFEKLEQMRRDL